MPSSIEELDDYVKVTLTGEALDKDKIKETISIVIKLCDETQKNCLIYRPEYSKQQADTPSFFELSKYWASLDLRNRKYAMVFPEKSLEENIQFMETTAKNRGVNVKIFKTIADAEEWLKT